MNDIYYSSSVPACITPLPSTIECVIESRSCNWVKFHKLAEQWKIERGARSSITQMVMMPAYLSIIGMGDAAVPLIISELKSEGDDPDHWFWALRSITGITPPIAQEDRGDTVRMAQAWIKWAEDEGYAG